MTTIEAMKQAMDWVSSRPDMREISAGKMESILFEAIATEEAQGVESVYLVPTGIVHEGWETYTRHDVCPPLCDAEKLFTRPDPPPADHIGAATKLAGERAVLIEKLKWAAKVGGDAILHVGGADTHKKAADMLAADAQEVERKYISPVRTIADLVNNLLLMDQALPIYGAQYIDHPTRGRCAIAVSPTVSRERVQDSRWIGQGNELNAAIVWTRAAQQVAVPQGWKLVPESPTLEMMSQMPASCNSGEWCEYYSAMLAATPKPPQADALAADHAEDVRVMVPMTEEQLATALNSYGSSGLLMRIARAVECHHGIGVKP